MASKTSKKGGSFITSIKSSLSSIGGTMNNKSVNGHGGIEVISPRCTEDAAHDTKGELKQEEKESLWQILKKNIGSDITSLGIIPVSYFEPTTTLQRMAEKLEYFNLLDQADECEDPYMRLVYASTWAMSFYFTLQRTRKAINPILGETYEMVNHGSFTYIAEQVSHHPPIDAAHAENEHFTYDMTSNLKTKLLGNSVDIYPVGRKRVTLKRDDTVLDFDPPPSKANNILFGRMWVSTAGDMIMTNMTTGDKVVLKFQPSGWFGGACFDLNGYVYNAAKEPKILMTGKWNKSMSYQPCDMAGKPLSGTELKEVWRVADLPENDKYHFTYFTHKIISFDTAPKKLLASDSRLRPDRYALEKGDLSKAGREKNSLEVRQRNEKKKREANGHQFKPRWFDLTGEVATTQWGDVPVYEFNGKYNEHRAAVNSSDNIKDEVDVRSTEFNPWQYGNL